MNENIKKNANKGFTLVELIIIIAIMAILTAAITLSVIRYIETSRQTIDVYNASLIKDALNIYPFPSDFQGRPVTYTDPITHESETYTRGWVYVDRNEIRCSDQSTALAMIKSGLVIVSPETERALELNEESSTKWFPTGPDKDYIRKSDIDEYVFKNQLIVKATRTWNTYQLDVYIDEGGELHLGASASNAIRTNGHAKDTNAAKLFSEKLGFYNAKDTPLGEQYNGN